ncbi:alkaline phosphatase family protein [Isachenkonia alkalipeptolytica]|uniref:Peptidase n=1 Tax=Isachenkonia alkalipeptolytica TaxID=2565777 RepID=A0AA43XKT2_9CLOT|nr:alkaline phosphatase family protein [Isachenkonia alkalipeptolytica]NBG88532.1 peptidase [Isachenkonia alkalipeptolytica]
MENKRVLLLFVDGFGIGREEKAAYNPIETGDLPSIQSLLKEGIPVPTDATLGVPGIPQSASGQTTILTGVNAPKVIGKHLNGFPNKELREIIEKENIFIKLKKLGLRVTNANAYNKKFISNLISNSKAVEEMSVSTVATLSAGLSLRTEEDLKKQTAVYQDITNRIMLEKWKAKVPIRTPREAAETLGEIVKKNDFTFFEYFQTDLAGHRKDFENAYRVLEELDQFIAGILESFCFKNTLFIFISDHGNIEDLSTPYHTMNKVPMIALGNGSNEFRLRVNSIQDITPSIENYFE